MAVKYLVLIAKRAETKVKGKITNKTQILICRLEGQRAGSSHQGILLNAASAIEPDAEIIFDSSGLELPPLFTENFNEVPPKKRPTILKFINQLRKSKRSLKT
jgi:hypothetical protein